MYLILVKHTGSDEDLARAAAVHRKFLDQACDAGRVLVFGPQVPKTGGVIIARARTRQEVDELIHGDPFYQEKIADYQVIEFQALKCHPALVPLL
jgi:uncharacterized protein YciI